MIEISQDLPTHFARGFGSLARLDRAYITTPPWMLQQLVINCSLIGDPVALVAKGVSDHGAVNVQISTKAAKNRQPQPIPKMGHLGPKLLALPQSSMRTSEVVSVQPYQQMGNS